MNFFRPLQKLALTFLCLQALLACSPAAMAWHRDWQQDPAYVEIPRAERVAVVGDVHGAFAEMAASLAALGVIEPVATNTFQLKWTGGKTVLVFMGDFPDRGLYSKEVYDAVMDLEQQAPKTGGRVVAVLGNHELYQINRTNETRVRARDYEYNRGAKNTVDSFERGGVNYYDAMNPKGKYGSWIRRRPLFAIVNNYLFIHGGPAFPALDREEMAREYKRACNNNFLLYSEGILNFEFGPLFTRNWWSPSMWNFAKDRAFLNKALAKLNVRGVVFGHTPGPLGAEGFVNHLDTRAFSVDIGMTPFYGHSNGGGLLMTIEPNGAMVFRARYPDRPEQILTQIDFATGQRLKPFDGILRSDIAGPAPVNCAPNLFGKQLYAPRPFDANAADEPQAPFQQSSMGGDNNE